MRKTPPLSRRDFIERLAFATGATVMLPLFTHCDKGGSTTDDDDDDDADDDDDDDDSTDTSSDETGSSDGTDSETGSDDFTPVPDVKPAKWNPVDFNTERGDSGAIPEAYMKMIKAAGGDTMHLGKHLPYVPKVEDDVVPAGYLALMWGDESKGNAKHPNADKSTENPDGHWYNWIRVRKSSEEADQVESTFDGWPMLDNEGSGKYEVFGDGKLEDNMGKDTIYLVKLPDGVKSGDTVRIWAHCITHGEYVDFIEIP